MADPDYIHLVPNPEGPQDNAIYLSTIRRNLRKAAGQLGATDITRVIHRLLEEVALPRAVRKGILTEKALLETEEGEADLLTDDDMMRIFELIEYEIETEMAYWLFRPHCNNQGLQEYLRS